VTCASVDKVKEIVPGCSMTDKIHVGRCRGPMGILSACFVLKFAFFCSILKMLSLFLSIIGCHVSLVLFIHPTYNKQHVRILFPRRSKYLNHNRPVTKQKKHSADKHLCCAFLFCLHFLPRLQTCVHLV